MEPETKEENVDSYEFLPNFSVQVLENQTECVNKLERNVISGIVSLCFLNKTENFRKMNTSPWLK